MSNSAIPTKPPSKSDTKLREKFDESIAAQSEQMDKLGQQLITLELAIPGLYATVLKLISGDKATLALGPALYLSFIFWFLALVAAWAAVFPRNWKVNRSIMAQDPEKNAGVLGIEDFFHKTAQNKRLWLFISSLLFFAGVVSSAFTIF